MRGFKHLSLSLSLCLFTGLLSAACQSASVPVLPQGFAAQPDEATVTLLDYRALTLRHGGQIRENDPEPGSTTYSYRSEGKNHFIVVTPEVAYGFEVGLVGYDPEHPDEPGTPLSKD